MTKVMGRLKKVGKTEVMGRLKKVGNDRSHGETKEDQSSSSFLVSRVSFNVAGRWVCLPYKIWLTFDSHKK